MKRILLCALAAALGGVIVQAVMLQGMPARSTEAGRDPSPASYGSDSVAPRADPDLPVSDPAAPTPASDLPPPSPAVATAAPTDRLVDLAATEPRAALEQALGIEGYWLRRDTAERIALVWAAQSPDTALGFIDDTLALDPETRSVLRAAVLETWAAASPERALAYLLGADGSNLFFVEPKAADRMARRLAARDPLAVLAATDGLHKGLVRNALRDAAIPSLVEQDLNLALRQAAIAVPGADHRQWIAHIELPFVRADPVGAFEWALAIEAGNPGSVQRVSRLVIQLYPDRITEYCEFDPGIDPGC